MSETQVKESYFWQQVKAGLEDEHTHLSRIENSAGTGISDVSACSCGLDRWIELKVFHGKRLHFRNSQRNWIVRRSQVGGVVFVLARKDDQLIVYKAMDLMNCSHDSYPEKKSFSIKAEDLPTPLFSCMKPFKWGEVRKILFSIDA